MGTVELKNLISESVKSADIGLLQYIAEAIKNYDLNKSPESVLTKAQIKELDRRRERYLAGEGKSYTWDEVKQKLGEKYGFSS